jgi:LmbE family N-acetylglucosaminyl deacetylase
MPAPTSALVVTAHPDDCEFGCGGTLAKWTGAGTVASLIVLTDGSKGSHDPEEDDVALRERRETEQRAASTVLGVGEVRFFRQVDGELAVTPELVLQLTAAIRELKPQVLLAHDPWRPYDLHPDHAVAGEIARQALYAAREPRAARELAARGLEPWRPDDLLLFGAEQPDHVEDIDAVFDVKVEALLCHRSQYVTSFGIGEDGTGRDRFMALLRDYYAAQSGSGNGTLGEAFRRLPLVRHTS